MAIMIPGSIEHLEGATNGEKRLFKTFRSILPDDHYVWYDHPVMERYPDFIIVGPALGIIILEVKDWEIDSIIDMDNEDVELKTTGRKPPNPCRQARIYMRGLLDLLSKYPDLKQKEGKYEGNLKFNYGCGAVLTRIAEIDWTSKKYANAILPQHLISKTDLDLIESRKDTKYLLQKLKGMVPTSHHFTDLSGEDLDLIIKIVSKKVTDRNQKPKDEEPPTPPSPRIPSPPEPAPRPQLKEKRRMPAMLALSAIMISVLAVSLSIYKSDPPKREEPKKPPYEIPQLPTQKSIKDADKAATPAFPEHPPTGVTPRKGPLEASNPGKIMPADVPSGKKSDKKTTSGNFNSEKSSTTKIDYGPRKGALIKGNISKSGEKIYHVPGQRYYEKTIAERLFRTEDEAIQAGFRRAMDIRIKGNINEQGERIYHMPGQKYYDKTRAKEWFNTEDDALNAGYRKSKI